jgi:hypothetical protein
VKSGPKATTGKNMQRQVFGCEKEEHWQMQIRMPGRPTPVDTTAAAPHYHHHCLFDDAPENQVQVQQVALLDAHTYIFRKKKGLMLLKCTIEKLAPMMMRTAAGSTCTAASSSIASDITTTTADSTSSSSFKFATAPQEQEEEEDEDDDDVNLMCTESMDSSCQVMMMKEEVGKEEKPRRNGSQFFEKECRKGSDAVLKLRNPASSFQLEGTKMLKMIENERVALLMPPVHAFVRFEHDGAIWGGICMGHYEWCVNSIIFTGLFWLRLQHKKIDNRITE